MTVLDNQIYDMKLKEYIETIDPKKLMLSLPGVILGTMLAAADFHVNWLAAAFLVLTVLLLQLIPNAIPGILCAFAAVHFSYGTLFLLDPFIMLLLGYLVYRFVRHHSSESGLFRNGLVMTLSTLLVYGVVPVFGTYYVCTHSFGSWILFLPSCAVGALCMAVRNSDTIDRSRDRAVQIFWIASGLVCMTIYSCLRIFDPWHFLYILSLPVFIWLIYVMWTGRMPVERYGLILSAAVLMFALLSGTGYLIYLI